jgi:hypothetical protein
MNGSDKIIEEFIIKQHQAGVSYQKIGELVGLTRSQVRHRYKKLTGGKEPSKFNLFRALIDDYKKDKRAIEWIEKNRCALAQIESVYSENQLKNLTKRETGKHNDVSEWRVLEYAAL